MPTSPSAFVDEAAARLSAGVDAALRSDLAERPLEVIRDGYGIPVHERPEARGNGYCSVDGSYFHSPPRINVAQSASRGRRYFTALHELAHHLILLDDELCEQLALLPGGGGNTQETICDAFAAHILIPAEVVDECIPAAGPSASDVAQLVEATQASRSACCAAAARRLRGEGYVIVADLDGTIRYAAQAQPTFVIAPGTAQPAGSILVRAGRSGAARDTTTVTYATGTQSPSFHGDAVQAGDYVLAVLTRGRPPWGGLNLLPDEGPRGQSVTCSQCEADFEAYGRPCEACGDYRCTACKQCACDDTGPAEALCHRCFLRGPKELIDAGDCPNCP